MRTREAEGVDFETHLEVFLQHLESHRYSDEFRKDTRRLLSRVFTHLRAKKVADVRAVTEAHLVSYIRFLRDSKTRYGKPFAPFTLSRHVYAIRKFFRFLDKRSVILRNPAMALSLPKAQSLPKPVLTEEQVKRLLDVPSPTSTLGVRDRAILEVFYGTGIRLGECLRLDVADVDLQSGSLWVRSGKGRKDRLLPIPRRTLEAMALYLRGTRPFLVHSPSEQAFFLTRAGERVSRSSIGAMLREHGKTAGIPQVHPHAMRHAYATHLLQRGADLRHIQELLGHNWIQTTAVYTKVQVKDLLQIIDKAHPRERGKNKRRKPR